ncbi:MAG: adenylate/guanylate cyclase domain-containing protein [Alphaproteobacteria bacterium]|nr:adenylate/guanylate cyclase domain-containing protein [Alphaproteobacteria bacterium]
MLSLETIEAPRPAQISPEQCEHLKAEANEICAWLVNDARAMPGPTATFSAFCERIQDAGVPLDRASLAIETRHAEQSGLGWFWEAGSGTDLKTFPYGAMRDEVYLRSPFAWVHETGEWLHLDICKTGDTRFGIIPELKEAGFTDYICAPMPFEATNQNGMSFATKSPGGFAPQHVALLKRVLPTYKLVAEVMALNYRVKTVLRTYVGDEPQKRILAGDIHRGEVVRIRSAIMFIDMRNFTPLSMNMTAPELAEFLNRYYDCLVPSIERHGGEVLKFVGDGVLAVFRTDGNGAAQACLRALEAARGAMDAVNRERNGGPGPKFNIKVALHFGRVAYGNVGSGDRLDFTVIGRDVNIASRLSTLCGQLERTMLVSGDFRDRISNIVEFIPAGTHYLRGVSKKQDVFEPAE